jgi:hypothetical protein
MPRLNSGTSDYDSHCECSGGIRKATAQRLRSLVQESRRNECVLAASLTIQPSIALE